MGYSEDLAIEKRPKMRCNWASKSPSYFLPVPKNSFPSVFLRLGVFLVKALHLIFYTKG